MNKEPLDGHLAKTSTNSGLNISTKYILPILFISFVYLYLFRFDTIFIEPFVLHSGWTIEIATRVLLFLIGIFLFWRDQKIGWYTLVVLLTYNALSTLYMGIQEWLLWHSIDPELLDDIFVPIGSIPFKGIWYYTSGFIINLICLILINQKSIMAKYGLNHYARLSSIIYTLILFCLLVVYLSRNSY